MFHIHAKYRWERGKPIGEKLSESGFRILSDPYGKRFMIEEVAVGDFQRIIYDSLLFDFRKLQEREQVGWSKEWISDEQLLVRDRDHLPLFIETYQYEGDRPKSCQLSTPHGLLFANQEIISDPFHGVILKDLLGQVIMKKEYEVDDNGEFTTLLKQEY